jgi:hypothetical protein
VEPIASVDQSNQRACVNEQPWPWHGV